VIAAPQTASRSSWKLPKVCHLPTPTAARSHEHLTRVWPPHSRLCSRGVKNYFAKNYPGEWSCSNSTSYRNIFVACLADICLCHFGSFRMAKARKQILVIAAALTALVCAGICDQKVSASDHSIKRTVWYQHRKGDHDEDRISQNDVARRLHFHSGRLRHRIAVQDRSFRFNLVFKTPKVYHLYPVAFKGVAIGSVAGVRLMSLKTVDPNVPANWILLSSKSSLKPRLFVSLFQLMRSIAAWCGRTVTLSLDARHSLPCLNKEYRDDGLDSTSQNYRLV